VTTPVRPFRGQRLRLHAGALRWLLGARPESLGYECGNCTHGAIVRYRYLKAKCYSKADWEAHLAELWQTHKARVQAWHLRHWPNKRPPRTPFEAERIFRARHRRRNEHRMLMLATAARRFMMANGLLRDKAVQ
jgi:hypothetical protein